MMNEYVSHDTENRKLRSRRDLKMICILSPLIFSLLVKSLFSWIINEDYQKRAKILTITLISILILCSPGYAWEKGNHAGDWVRGQSIYVCVDTPPGDAAQQQAYLDAVDEAIDEWNTAQAEFGGLVLFHVPAPCDVRIHWKDNADSWGAVSPGKNPVNVTIESNDGLTARGVTRILKHEFGHVEGLGHSAKSDLMKKDAYSSTPPNQPSVADLNSTDPFTEPTADDKAGKKAMYGTVAKKSKSDAESSATPKGEHLWMYRYTLQAIAAPSLIDPVTQFTLGLALGVVASHISVTAMPPGWEWTLYDGRYSSDGKPLDTGEVESPSYLSFEAINASFGVLPGQSVVFEFESPLAPAPVRAFTNSPSYDSDEFTLLAPRIFVAVGYSPLWFIITLVILMISGGLLLRRRITRQ